LELALNEEQIPRFVGNNRKRKQDMEGLERVTLLAKQVLSQLSYTPTVWVSNANFTTYLRTVTWDNWDNEYQEARRCAA